MTFCNCNVIVTRLICMFITGVKYDIYCMTILHGQWPMLYNKNTYTLCIVVYISMSTNMNYDKSNLALNLWLYSVDSAVI